MTPASRDRRALAGGAAVIVMLIAASRGIPMARRWESASRAMAIQVESELARALSSTRAHPAAVRALAAYRTRLVALAGTLLEGESMSAASAALVALVSEAAQGAGARVGNVQALPASGAPTGVRVLTPVGVRVSVTGNLEAVASLLSRLEAGPKLIAVRELVVTHAEAAPEPGQPETLRAEIIVEGLVHAVREAAMRRTP
jgi:hypothetical protein